MATNKEQRLLELLARETNKMGPVPGGRRPAQFRETLRDTHKTMPAEDFGPSTRGLGLGTGTAGSRSQGGSHSARGPGAGAGRSQSLGRAGTRTRNAHSALPFGPEATEFRSVFKPRPDQEHVCSMAREHRDRIAKSEWALLDTLEVQMYLDEKAARARQIEAEKAAQRAFLDGQMREKAVALQAEEAEKTLDREVLMSELDRYKRDEAAKAQAAFQKNVTLKNERLAMLEKTRAAKAQALEARRAQEAKDLADAQRALEADKAKAAAKQEALKAQWLATRRDNEARIAARKAAEVAQKEADEAMMRETIATLERQEREREEKIKAFHHMIAARADRAGQKAVEENRERAEREARLIAQFAAQKEAEYAAKEAEAKAKKAAQKEELLKAREAAQAAKAAKAAAIKEQQARELADADARAEAEAIAEARKMAGIRARATANKDFLRTQIVTKERTAVVDDTGMSEAERALNARLLEQATRIVGEPKQYTVKLY